MAEGRGAGVPAARNRHARAVAWAGNHRRVDFAGDLPPMAPPGLPRCLQRRASAPDGPRPAAGGDDGLRGGERGLTRDRRLAPGAEQGQAGGGRRDRAGRSGAEDRRGPEALRADAGRAGSVETRRGARHQPGADDRRLRGLGPERRRGDDRAGGGAGAVRREGDRPGPRRTATEGDEAPSPSPRAVASLPARDQDPQSHGGEAAAAPHRSRPADPETEAPCGSAPGPEAGACPSE
jgi:hypothetical protein